jgi:hypothetical protein
LDLLSDSQEAQLQHRIRYEIAMYLRWVRSRTLQTSILQTSTNSALPQATQFKLSPITIPTLWTNPSSLGFFSLLNLQDLPNLQELPNLIQAALRYFFGPSRRYYIRGDNQTRLTDEPWFKLQTLWGTPPIAVLQAPNLQAPASDRTTSPITAIPLVGGTTRISTNRLVKPRTISRSPAPITFNKASSTVSNTSSVQEHENTRTQNNLVKKTTAGTKHSPDWLEAKSVDLGYKKNWPDRCIGWLDWVLVKIEQTFLTIWQALVTLFQSR